MTSLQVWPGKAYPLGATFDGTGTNFSIFSEVAEKIELCLFDDEGNETRVELPESTGRCWHGYFPTILPGQRYGFRVYGPWDPKEGHRCNPSNLLLDPYAKAIDGEVKWDEAVFPHHFYDPEETINEIDSAPYMPKSVVINPFFDWMVDRPPHTSLHESVIYEIHVKGFTKQMMEIPEEIRGTYAGLGHPVAIDYLQKLGVTAVELLPVHQFIHDGFLVDRGLRNYWGYNSIGFLAPHNDYCSQGGLGQQVPEFKQMVKNLHDAGLEVILDVVYNHTAEGNHLGPMLCFKGIDNAYYYRLVNDDRRYYMDYTGTGNTLNMRHPHVLQLVMDSLRYWVLDMHVDGFRFDLAATLARGLHDMDRLSAFFDLIQQDPVISQVKLIAEPWDIGEGGYHVGNFPSLWSEWNGKFRDTVREYWRGQDYLLGEFANRLTGSSDLYEGTGRRPFASVNFITAHDGFTLNDLVSYNDRHNEANGDNNEDGDKDNHSWNCGAEGPTHDASVLALRARQKRNFLTTLLLSQGVPMLLGGDEFGRTQQGNNNTYCQDSELSWFDWKSRDLELTEFTKFLIDLRRNHPNFRRWKWLRGRAAPGSGRPDILWFKPDGTEMTEDDWNTWFAKTLTVFLNGKAIEGMDPRGLPVVDDDFYLIFNAHFEPLEVSLPKRTGKTWAVILDTNTGYHGEGDQTLKPGDKIELVGRSMMVLRHVE